MGRKNDGSKQPRDKKKGGGQQQAKKRKHYSPDIPLRKMKRMLESSSAEFVAKRVIDANITAGAISDVGQALKDLAHDGAGGKYGQEVVALAREALDKVTELLGFKTWQEASAEQEKAGGKLDEDTDPEMVELERLTRPDPKK